MTSDDIIGRSQKRLDALTEGLRELIGELTNVIVDKDADIASLAAEIVWLRNQLAEIIPVHERQAELDSHG